MKLKIASAALFAATATLSLPAFADHKAREASRDVISLADGGTLYIFQDGKMAKANQFGRAVYLKNGEVLPTTDGKRVQASSNEIAKLTTLLMEDYPGD